MNPNTASSGQQQQQQQQNGVGNQMAAPDTSAFLRRRSGQITDSPPSHPHQPGTPIGTLANRRAAAGRAMTQNDWSLSLTSLSTPPNTPPMTSTIFTRTTTPTPSASSPLTTPFGKRRAADEIKAVTDMLNGVTDTAEIGNNAESSSTTSGIQRPASAPPRGRRSRRPSRELNDAGVDAMEKAPPLPTTKEVPTSITGIASETIEQFAAHLSDRSLALLFLFIVAWGAVLSLDRLTTYSYQTIATNSFSHHSALAEVNVIRSVVAAVAALPFATIADLGGRAQAFTIGLVLYAAGHAAMAGSTSIPSYVGGVILYESGANGLVCLQATVLADMTSSRNRLFFQIVPQMPFLVFSFISSDIYSAILPRWRWGIGMFAILGPAALLPVIAILGNSQKQSGSSNVSVNSKSSNNSPSQSMRRASLQQCESALSYTLLMIKHVWQTSDVLGLLLMVASLCLTLIPLTIAASSPDQWESPKILGMISAGLVAIFLFSMWELRMAKNPLIPRVLLQNRTFWGGALALTSLWAAHELMLAYFPTYLYVVHGVSNRAQQNFSVIYSFTVAAASLPIALMVRHSRRFKVFTIVGVVIFTAGLGMMIGYKGTADSRFEIASSQAIIGLGGALTIALIQAAVQVSVTPTFVAQSIAALNIFPSIGTAIGAAIAGAMWTGLLPGKLARNLTPTGHLNELPTIYAEPLTWIESNGLGTSTRTAVVNAYTSCWRTMMITATLICALSLVPILYTENLKLNDSLSAEEAIGEEEVAYSGAIKPSKMVTKGGRLFGDSLFERMENALGRTLVRRVPKKVLPDSPTDIKTSDMSMMASTSSTSSSSSHLTVPGKMNGSSTNREKSNQKSRWSNAWGALRGPSLGGGGNGKMNNSISSVMEGGIESLHIPTPTLIVDHGTPSPTSPQDTSIPAPILVVDEPPNDSPLQIPTPPGSRGSIGSLSPLPSPLTSFKSLSPNRGEEK